MFVRHILLAGLFATASFAQAGTVPSSIASSASAPGAVAPAAFHSLLAGPSTSVVRMGERSQEVTTLFAQGGAAPVAFTETVKTGVDASLTAPAAGQLANVVINAGAAIDPPAAPAVVPEPATGALLLVGLLGAGFMSRRRN